MTIDDLQRLRGYECSGVSGQLYKGGPVSEQSLMMLHTDDWMSTNTIQTSHGNCISSDELMLDKMVQGNLPKCWRLMSGMSTWLVPQLQSEIYKHKAWLVVEPNLDIFYNYDNEDQWEAGVSLASSRLMDEYF